MANEQEVLERALEYSDKLDERFLGEVNRILNSGLVDSNCVTVNTVMVVALENLADSLTVGSTRYTNEYRNMRTI